jgi:hypothetical protein
MLMDDAPCMEVKTRVCSGNLIVEQHLFSDPDDRDLHARTIPPQCLMAYN